MNKWTSRKLISAWCLTWLNAGLLYLGILPAEVYASLMGGVWLFWFSGHHMDKRIGKDVDSSS